MKIRLLLTVALTWINYVGYAEDLGVVGKTYPILEPDMIEWIKFKADVMIKSGQWQQIQNKAISNAKNQINNPEPISGITDCFVNKTWYYKPMIQLKADLTDTKGHVIAKAGLYNALKYKPFDTQLLFINGNNAKQISWAINHAKNDGVKIKIVLTQGSFINLDKQYKIWFFYDQNGKYTQKLDIHHVPAIVVQDGEQLKITELNNTTL